MTSSISRMTAGGKSETTSHLLSGRWVFTSVDFHRKMLCSEWEVVLDTIVQRKAQLYPAKMYNALRFCLPATA